MTFKLSLMLPSLAGLLSSICLWPTVAPAAPLPDFQLGDINTSFIPGTQVRASARGGQSLKLSEYRGRVVVVYFGQEN